MNKKEFMYEINRLYDGFNVKFTGMQLNMLFERVKILSQTQWEVAVELILLESSKAPTIASIIQAASPVLNEARRRQNSDLVAQIANKGLDRCKGCFGTGLCTVVNRKGIEAAARCKCEAAEIRNISKHIPSLKAMYRMNYKIADWPKSGFNKPAPKLTKKVPATPENLRKFANFEINLTDLHFESPEQKRAAIGQVFNLSLERNAKRASKQQPEGKSRGEGMGSVAQAKPRSVGKERAAEQGHS